MRLTALVTPSLTLEHLEQGDLLGGQGIALDDLQMLHIKPTLPGGFIDRT